MVHRHSCFLRQGGQPPNSFVENHHDHSAIWCRDRASVLMIARATIDKIDLVARAKQAPEREHFGSGAR
eukprot:1881239-Rhodomonas_salina.1